MVVVRRSLRHLRDGARHGLIAIERLGPLGAAATLRKRQPAVPAGLMPAPGALFNAIYVVGDREGEPQRYRVHNPAAALRAQGCAVHVIDIADVGLIRRRGWLAQALVLFRAEYDRLVGIGPALDDARSRGMRILYDIDDLVFDPAIVGHIDGLRHLGRYERSRFVATMAARRRLLRAADAASVATAPLARAVERLGIPAHVVPNALNREQLKAAAALLAQPRPRGGILRIGYCSGSRTHQRDFAECEPALFTLMQRCPELHFRLVGWLDLPPAWRQFGERVEVLGFRPAAELLQATAGMDINLAPLEPGNPFCEAKSELKFFEAAAVAVPTVATATEPFAAAIEDGVNGVLVREREAWLPLLSALIEDPARRRRLGAAARARALAHYTPDAVLPQLLAALDREKPARAIAPEPVAASV